MNHKQISILLRDYHWIVKEIARQRGMLNDAGENLTAAYGIDSVMPKGSGTGDPIFVEVQRRIKKSKRIEKLERKAKFVQDRIHLIMNDRERTVLECILDGMSYRAVSRHMGLSEKHIRNIKESIVMQFAEYAESANSEKMQDQEACV